MNISHKKISHKLIGSFCGISLLTAVVGVVAIAESQKITETLAITEAEHVAKVLALSITHTVAHASATQGDRSIQQSEELQHFTKLLHDDQQRDVVVVDRQKRILADAIPENVGSTFDDDLSNEVGLTIQDGKSRIFLEKSVDYPQGIKLIVIPRYLSPTTIDGAIILEWSSLYDEAIAQARPTMILIGLTSFGSIVLAWLIGLQIANSIAKPLQSVTTVAQQVIQTDNFDLQAPITTTDETGMLATALNDLIRWVKVLLYEKEQRSEELQLTLNQLQSVTTISQQVIQTDNFDLQAPVTTTDEAGILAAVLNDLIQRVKALLHEKEQRSEELQLTLNRLQETQLQLIQTEKMSGLGQLVAGVAHEINNPINFIHGNITHIDIYTKDLLRVVQAYQTHYPDPPQTIARILNEVELDFIQEDFVKLLQSTKVGTDRIQQIVLSLRNFSRLDESEFKPVDLHEGIDNTLMILQHRIKENPDFSAIEIIKAYGELPLVECYAGQLNQVFMNLIANAIDALEESIQTRKKDGQTAKASMILISTQLITEEWVQIMISDNGSGMPEPVRSRIFNPFFTTKSVGKGTGLGLSISSQIITERHNGKIWCDSTPEEGTKFVIEIPIHQPEPTSLC